MKIILVDYCNDGIIYAGDSIVVANLLKRGLVDADIFALSPSNPAFNKINRNEILYNTSHLSLQWKSLDAIPMSEESKNPIYLERKKLCTLRAPIMERLVRYTFTASLTSKITIWEGFENNLEVALTGCDPESNTYSNAVLEYAHINNVDPAVAFREIKLQTENINSQKMKIYSYQKYFSDKINLTTTEDQIKELWTELIRKFTEDNHI